MALGNDTHRCLSLQVTTKFFFIGNKAFSIPNLKMLLEHHCKRHSDLSQDFWGFLPLDPTLIKKYIPSNMVGFPNMLVVEIEHFPFVFLPAMGFRRSPTPSKLSRAFEERSGIQPPPLFQVKIEFIQLAQKAVEIGYWRHLAQGCPLNLIPWGALIRSGHISVKVRY